MRDDDVVGSLQCHQVSDRRYRLHCLINVGAKWR